MRAYEIGTIIFYCSKLDLYCTSTIIDPTHSTVKRKESMRFLSELLSMPMQRRAATMAANSAEAWLTNISPGKYLTRNNLMNRLKIAQLQTTTAFIKFLISVQSDIIYAMVPVQCFSFLFWSFSLSKSSNCIYWCLISFLLNLEIWMRTSLHSLNRPFA